MAATSGRTTVYRLQVGRQGVFAAGVCGDADYDPPGPSSDYGLLKHIPSRHDYRTVEALAAKLGTTRAHVLFGFNSRTQLDCWFPPQRQRELIASGATVYAITLPATDVLAGRHQCVFKQSRFTRRKSINEEIVNAV